MDSERNPLHILLFPFLAQGHILPTIDLAKLFAAHGVKTTIVTTAGNAAVFQQSIVHHGHQNPIHLSLIPFPSGTCLPEGCENMSSVPQHLKPNFFDALGMLRQPFDRVLRDLLPDCVVAGLFLYWIHDLAAELNIPTLEFHGSNTFAKCTFDSVERHKILESPCEGCDSFVVIPDLPHRIELRRSLIPDFSKAAPFVVDLMNQGKVSGLKSHGLIVNSFYELEPDYVEYYKKVMGRRAWHVGPLLLCNDDDEAGKLRRGNMATTDAASCLKWLDSKSPSPVVYVCFGSASYFTVEQLHEIALGLEASNRPFIWVVRNGGKDAMPKGFEERVEGRGLVIRGWAPQVAILNHEAVGGFVTHCGWNSSLEGIAVGLPLITWPLFAEQSYNERLIVDVLKIGIAVGVKNFAFRPEERMLVDAAAIEKAVNGLMDEGEEAEMRRRRAKELGEMAKRAMEEGGSSYIDMSNLIEEFKEMRKRQI